MRTLGELEVRRWQLTAISTVVLLPVLLKEVLYEFLVVVIARSDLLHVDHAPNITPGNVEDPVPEWM